MRIELKREQIQRLAEKRAGDWETLEREEKELRGRSMTLSAADRLVRGYRELAADVASVRTLHSGSRLTAELEALYRRLHERLHRSYEPLGVRLVRLYRRDVPAAARRLRSHLLAVTGLFLFASAAGALLVHHFPELIALFASEAMINQVQRGELWTDHVFNVVPSSVAAAGIAGNNILVTFTAYALGVLYGLGTFYVIALNGLMLGALFVFTGQHGLAESLLRFVVPHGLAELSIILVAGAAGVRLGEALARPHLGSRLQSFHAATSETGRSLCVCIPFLAACAIVESYVSPVPEYPMALRLLVGIALALLFWTVLFRGTGSNPPAGA